MSPFFRHIFPVVINIRPSTHLMEDTLHKHALFTSTFNIINLMEKITSNWQLILYNFIISYLFFKVIFFCHSKWNTNYSLLLPFPYTVYIDRSHSSSSWPKSMPWGHANIEQIKIGRTNVSDLVNLVTPWSAPMVGKEEGNLKICHSRLRENTSASTRTAKNVP